MSYKQLDRQCNDAPARSREEAEKQFNEKLMGEAKLSINQKIEDGQSDIIAWGDLLSEFLSMSEGRINAALKRLSPKQLLTLEQLCNENRETAKDAAIEKARLFMLQLGITMDDLSYAAGQPRPMCKEVKRVMRKQRPWAKSFRQDLHRFYLDNPQRVLLSPADTKTHFIVRYPEITNEDISKGKNYLQTNKGVPRASDMKEIMVTDEDYKEALNLAPLEAF